MTKHSIQYDRLYTYLMDNMDITNEIIEVLNLIEGSYEDLIPRELSELMEYMTKEDIARAIIYGNVIDMDTKVIFDGYGNFQSVTEGQHKRMIINSMNEIIDDIEKYIDHVSNEEIRDILNS